MRGAMSDTLTWIDDDGSKIVGEDQITVS